MQLKKIKLGLRSKIISVVVICFMLMSGILTLFFVREQKTILISDTERLALSLAMNLAYDSAEKVLLGDVGEIDVLVKYMLREKSVIHVDVFDLHGSLLYCFHGNCANECRYVPAYKNLFKNKEYVLIKNDDKLKIIVPIKPYKEKKLLKSLMKTDIIDAGFLGYIVLDVSLAETMSELERIRNLGILIVGFVTVLFAFLLSRFINSLVIEPISVFADGAEIISSGRYDQQIDIVSDDEIGHLARSFNKMVHNINKSHQEILGKANELQEANRDLKNTQNQLVQSAKLSAIGQLTAGVSHELKNPLGGILGYAQFIMQKVRKTGAENLNPKELKDIVTYIEYIEKESIRCQSIISSLLKFSRVSTDDISLLNVNQVLEESIVLTQHQLDINEIEVIKELAPDLPEVVGNGHQLQQVFTNLMINAQQAMESGGKLTVSTKLNKGAVEISFADTGIGIAKENLQDIFNPFFTTKEEGKGTGLGLSVSYGIIQDHRGSIEVESEPGRGTVFYIKLPVGRNDCSDSSE